MDTDYAGSSHGVEFPTAEILADVPKKKKKMNHLLERELELPSIKSHD